MNIYNSMYSKIHLDTLGWMWWHRICKERGCFFLPGGILKVIIWNDLWPREHGSPTALSWIGRISMPPSKYLIFSSSSSMGLLEPFLVRPLPRDQFAMGDPYQERWEPHNTAPRFIRARKPLHRDKVMVHRRGTCKKKKKEISMKINYKQQKSNKVINDTLRRYTDILKKAIAVL